MRITLRGHKYGLGCVSMCQAASWCCAAVMLALSEIMDLIIFFMFFFIFNYLRGPPLTTNMHADTNGEGRTEVKGGEVRKGER
jgi:hypothetical protein